MLPKFRDSLAVIAVASSWAVVQTLVLDANPRLEADLNREEREPWESVLGDR